MNLKEIKDSIHIKDAKEKKIPVTKEELKAYVDAIPDVDLEGLDVFDENGRQVKSTRANLLKELWHTANESPDEIISWLNPEWWEEAKKKMGK